MTAPARRGLGIACLALLACSSSMAAPAAGTRTGVDIFARFQNGLAEPGCDDASPRWQAHYASAVRRLAARDGTALAVFGYVLDDIRKAGLPSELALIPFVETRFRADVRSAHGPAGLWQFTAATARRNGLRVRAGEDERLSVAGSTRAAVRYLRRLHRLFGRQWRQTAMAYNAGEGALAVSRKTNGRRLSGITRSYPGKLHAIACLFAHSAWQDRQRPAIAAGIPRLAPRSLPRGTRNLRGWARAQGLDPEQVIALNPGWHHNQHEVLAPVAQPPVAGRKPRRKAH